MARQQFTFTFTNAEPGSVVSFDNADTDHLYVDATSNTRLGHPLILGANNTFSVWTDATHLTAVTEDGVGNDISATATVSNPTVTTNDGTAPTGDVSSPVIVSHGSTASAARPSSAIQVLWIGSVAPTNAAAGDQWRDTANNWTRWNVGGVWFYPPGAELAAAVSTASDTTTNTARTSAHLNVISGLTLSNIVGTGQAVDIEFICPVAVHSVASTGVNVDLVINGADNTDQIAAVSSPATNSGRTLVLRWRKVLTAGTTYTFQVGKWLAAAGTGTYGAATNNPMTLSATCR